MRSARTAEADAFRGRWVLRATGALLARPSLWPTAVHQVLRLARPGWWRARPWLPLPEPTYLRFRLQTAYGDPDASPNRPTS